jgi:hypothetical protein
VAWIVYETLETPRNKRSKARQRQTLLSPHSSPTIPPTASLLLIVVCLPLSRSCNCYSNARRLRLSAYLFSSSSPEPRTKAGFRFRTVFRCAASAILQDSTVPLSPDAKHLILYDDILYHTACLLAASGYATVTDAWTTLDIYQLACFYHSSLPPGNHAGARG